MAGSATGSVTFVAKILRVAVFSCVFVWFPYFFFRFPKMLLSSGVGFLWLFLCFSMVFCVFLWISENLSS